MEGSMWFKRTVRDLNKLSVHFRFKYIGHGFYRIYWKGAYLGECYKEMPEIGHDILERDFNMDDMTYYERYEDRATATRKIKNFIEGYWEVKDRMKTKLYLCRNNPTYYKDAFRAYSQMRIK